MSSHCFCTCVHLCVLPEGRQQQLCLIVTKPPRPQLDWSHWYRALLVGDRGGEGVWTCLAKSALIWAGSRFEPTKTVWWSEGWPGFQWAARVGLSGPPLDLWTTGHRCILLTKRWHIHLLCVSWGIFSLPLFPSMLMWLWDSFQVEGSCSWALLAAGLKRLFIDCIILTPVSLFIQRFTRLEATVCLNVCSQHLKERMKRETECMYTFMSF